MIGGLLRWRVQVAGLLLVLILVGAGLLVFQPVGPGAPSGAQEAPIAPDASAVPVATGAMAPGSPAPRTPGGPTPTPAPAAPALTAPPIKVYVIGAVAHPGVYALHEGDRIEDAIRQAGGAVADADLAAINLAARVQDEEEIRVPHRGEAPFTPVVSAPPPASPVIAGSGSGPPAAGTGKVSGTTKVNINTADATTLATLPRIGPALAARIIAYRTQHGPFARVEDIKQVSGIGDATYAALSAYITVGP